MDRETHKRTGNQDAHLVQEGAKTAGRIGTELINRTSGVDGKPA